MVAVWWVNVLSVLGGRGKWGQLDGGLESNRIEFGRNFIPRSLSIADWIPVAVFGSAELKRNELNVSTNATSPPSRRISSFKFKFRAFFSQLFPKRPVHIRSIDVWMVKSHLGLLNNSPTVNIRPQPLDWQKILFTKIIRLQARRFTNRRRDKQSK